MAGQTNDPIPKACTVTGNSRNYKHVLTIEPVGADRALVTPNLLDAKTGKEAAHSNPLPMETTAVNATTEMVKQWQGLGYRDIKINCDF